MKIFELPIEHCPNVDDILNGHHCGFGFHEKIDVEPGKYAFIYTYPLNRKATFVHALNHTDSVFDVFRLAANDYRNIETSNAYGQWGHSVGELFFEGLEIDEKKKIVMFVMGS